MVFLDDHHSFHKKRTYSCGVKLSATELGFHRRTPESHSRVLGLIMEEYTWVGLQGPLPTSIIASPFLAVPISL
jgi:hypothetical protein